MWEQGSEVPTGLLAIHGGYLPQQVRAYLHSGEAAVAQEDGDGGEDVIPFYVLHAHTVAAAAVQVRRCHYTLNEADLPRQEIT